MRVMFAKGYRLVLEEYGSSRERPLRKDKKRRLDMFFWENIVFSKIAVLEEYWIGFKHI